MGPTGDLHRILQVHPTRRCNLRCLHCYSLSGPEEREELAPELLTAASAAAAAEGYTVLAVSGGEPLMYGGLRQLLQAAHQAGMAAMVTTNGILLDKRRLEMLRGSVDLLAISLDGTPESHNRMRGSEQAFKLMRRRLPGLRESGIPFGFIFTLTQHNLDELDWVYRFAKDEGARLLQIHPLEVAGRAKETLEGSRPDAVEAGYAYLETVRLRSESGSAMQVQLDYSHRNSVAGDPDRVYAGDTVADRPLAELVSPLVVESDGTVVPLQHGLTRALALGNLHEAGLEVLAAAWRRDQYAQFTRVCRRVYEGMLEPSRPALSNWYELVADAADRELASSAIG